MVAFCFNEVRQKQISILHSPKVQPTGNHSVAIICHLLTRMSAVESHADVFAPQKLEVQQCTGGTLLNRTSVDAADTNAGSKIKAPASFTIPDTSGGT